MKAAKKEYRRAPRLATPKIPIIRKKEEKCRESAVLLRFFACEQLSTMVNYWAAAFAAKTRVKKVFLMIEQWSTPVWPISGKKPRLVYVYVPEEARENPEARFPVLYMFDGHNVFFDEDATYGKSWGMKDYMDGTQTPMMIVAVDCDHRPPHGRLSEYSPFTFQDQHFGRVYGRGKLFMDWLCGTLKPMIDERYPTLPGRETTWIAGSSMGGLMSLYALIAYNDVFSKAAALSPSVWVSPKKMKRLIAESEVAPGTVLYMDYGSKELSNHEGMMGKFGQVAQQLLDKGVYLTCRIVPGGEHCEACWEEQIPFFMNTLLYERD